MLGIHNHCIHFLENEQQMVRPVGMAIKLTIKVSECNIIFELLDLLMGLARC